MAKKKPLLTISLLSSGRSGTIGRCLVSLSPFKEQLDTEIIVVDTDAEHKEDVRAVLEKYADEIIPFEWCDDFSAARNAGVDAAHGEWFLFLDDDEWFVDAQPLIDFLRSDEEGDYHWGSYQIRNYYDEAHEEYQDSWVSRLFRLNGKARFYGRIHEYVHPHKGDPKFVPAMAEHVGYIYRSEEERLEHVWRNLDLLTELMEEEPQEMRWPVQAIFEYRLLRETEKELEAAERAYSLLDGAGGYALACVRGYVAADMLQVLLESGQHEQCYDRYRQLRRDRKNLGHTAEAYVEWVASRAAYGLGHYKDAKKHGLRYLRDRIRYKDEPIRCAEERLDFLADTFELESYESAVWMLFRIDLSEDNEDVYVAERIRAVWESERMRPILQKMLLSMHAESDDRYWKLLCAIAEAGDLQPEPLDLKIIRDDHIGERGNMPEYFTRLFAAVNPLAIDPMLWQIGLRRGAILDDRIAAVPMERWKACVEECVHGTTVAHMRQMLSIMDEVYLGMPDERYTYFQVHISEALRQAEEANRREVETQQRLRARQSAQAEMKQIIDALQDKVQQLVSAGMVEEADQVLKEMQKYTDMMG